MERRRYIPTSLGVDHALERRLLLSTTKQASIFGVNGPTAAPNDIPQNLAQRNQRIDRLPFFMKSYQPDRPLPASVTAPIQDDLRALIGKIHDPLHSVLNEFNRTIRSVSPTKTLSPLHATSLVKAFDAVLASSGTPDALRTKFTSDMLALAELDARGPEPTFQAINDFGIIAQLTQAVGQPFQAPSVPTIAPADLVRHTKNVTTNHSPRFVGDSYDGLTIQVVDASNGSVLASGVVPKGGRYTIQPTTPLADGTYTVQARTQDSGYTSQLSHSYTFQVTTPPRALPKGPRG